MGLRINTNISAITALRILKVNQRSQATSLERLSTGLRINRGSDDPSGLVISEQLRSQLSSLNQSISNSQNATNLLNVADAALASVSDLLVEIQTSITFAQNTGGSTPEQIAAEQDAVDQAVSAIDRIATTTRFADRALLNGEAAFQTSANVPDYFDDVDIKSISFPSDTFERTLEVTPLVNPQRAEIRIAGANVPTASGNTTLRITGARGTESIVLQAGADQNEIAGAINSVASYTGVFASASTGGGGSVLLRSEDFGADQFIKIEGVAGSMSGTIQVLNDGSSTDPGGLYSTEQTGLSSGQIVSDRGANGQVTFDGQVFEGVGRKFNILTRTVQFTFNVDPDLITSTASGAGGAAVPAGPFTLTVANTGLTFQLNSQPVQTDRLNIGINSVGSTSLGESIIRDRIAEAELGSAAPGSSTALQRFTGGSLDSLRTGAGNDLFTDPSNAARITQAAVLQVAKIRGYIGAITADALQPNIDSLGVAVESLSASLSDLRDVDFAEETSSFTRSQILFQSGIGVLASANTLPQSVLQLLGG